MASVEALTERIDPAVTLVTLPTGWGSASQASDRCLVPGHEDVRTRDLKRGPSLPGFWGRSSTRTVQTAIRRALLVHVGKKQAVHRFNADMRAAGVYAEYCDREPRGEHRVCNETNPDHVQDRQNVGARSGCVPDEDSTYLVSVADHVQFLRDLKQGRPLVLSAAISGPNDGTAVVGIDNGEPRLQPSCFSAMGEAVPAVRIDTVSQAFEAQDLAISICGSNFQSALADIAARLKSMMSGSCLAATPKDVDPAGGLQTDCRVDDVSESGESVLSIPNCESVSSPPCFEIITESAACPTGPNLEVRINRGGVAAAPGSTPVIRCTKAD